MDVDDEASLPLINNRPSTLPTKESLVESDHTSDGAGSLGSMDARANDSAANNSVVSGPAEHNQPRLGTVSGAVPTPPVFERIRWLPAARLLLNDALDKDPATDRAATMRRVMLEIEREAWRRGVTEITPEIAGSALGGWAYEGDDEVDE